MIRGIYPFDVGKCDFFGILGNISLRPWYAIWKRWVTSFGKMTKRNTRRQKALDLRWRSEIHNKFYRGAKAPGDEDKGGTEPARK
jgi:hypothetical protein